MLLSLSPVGRAKQPVSREIRTLHKVYDWMTAAKNMGKWHRGVERGAEALDSAWRRADLRQSNVQLQREVSEVVQ